MLAYLFWHQPAEGQERTGYEQALVAFHERLRTVARPSGLVGSGSARVGRLPWTPGEGYEDCYLVEGFSSLGTLNTAAVDDAHVATHNRVARAAGFGVGGLYALDSGEPMLAGGHCAWVTKPAGVDYDQFHKQLGPLASVADTAIWRRQMVLGPAPEFRLTGDHPFSLPAELEPLTCQRTAVGTT